ncbi:MAG: hypothetical protein ACOCVY_02570 [Patescibacteria group bacterium]
MCKRIKKKKQKQELEEAKGGGYKKRLDFYAKQAKRLWESTDPPETIREKLINLQKKLQI